MRRVTKPRAKAMHLHVSSLAETGIQMANKSLTMRQTPSALKKTPTDYETKLRKRQTGLGSPKYPRITALSPSHFRVIEFWDLCDDSTALRLSSLASLYFESHETFLHSLRKGGLLITLKCLFKSFPTLLAYIIILYLLRKCLVRTTISF
jgi:hypothetical protein